MRRFVFKLQTTYKVKKHKEEGLKTELHQALVLYQDALDVLEGLEIKQESCQEQMQIRCRQGLSSREASLWHRFLSQVAADVGNQRVRVASLAQEVDGCRQRLMGAMAERRAMEKLRDRHLAAYRQIWLKEEQKALDEMALNGHIRRDGNTG